MTYDDIVKNMAIIGDTNAEKKRMRPSRANNFRRIPITAGMRSTSSAKPLK